MNGSELPTGRICLVLQSGIGDVVHGLPLVNALKRDDPGRQIVWVVERGPAPLLCPHPAVDDVVLYDRRGGMGELLSLRRKLRHREFDLVINCGIYFKSAPPTYLARARHKLGFGRDRANDFIWVLANHRLPPRGPRHRQDMYLEFLTYLGIAAEPLEWRISLTEEERGAQAHFFEELGADRVVGIVTTTAMEPKDWPVERFAALATVLARDLGFRVVLLGGPGARERGRAREVVKASEADTVWALGGSLRRLVYLIDGCDLLVAPDTGPLHIARALETPVVGLYGHTDPGRAGPYGKYQDLVVDRYNYEGEGRPYEGRQERQHPARAGGRARMAHIGVQDVVEKVELALERYVVPGEVTE